MDDGPNHDTRRHHERVRLLPINTDKQGKDDINGTEKLRLPVKVERVVTDKVAWTAGLMEDDDSRIA